MKKLASVTLAGLVVLMGAFPAQAQQGTWELGVDGGFVFTSPDGDGADSMFDVSLPFQLIRAGVFVTPQISIEPTVAFNRLDFGGDETLTQLSLLATGLYHLSTDRTRAQYYLQAGGGVDYVSFSGDESASQWLAAAGGGVKLPIMDQVSVRLGALYVRSFEDEDAGLWAANSFRGQVGLSLFSH
jgi:hypothetical protein